MSEKPAKTKKKSKQMGRPKIDIDWEKMKAFMRLKPTLEDTAAFFLCGTTTIEDRIKDEFGLTFREFREQNMVHTRYGLIRKAIKKAEDGDNTMLIFALKNMCGWTDKQTIEHEGNPDKPIAITAVPLSDRIKIAKGEK